MQRNATTPKKRVRADRRHRNNDQIKRPKKRMHRTTKEILQMGIRGRVCAKLRDYKLANQLDEGPCPAKDPGLEPHWLSLAEPIGRGPRSLSQAWALASLGSMAMGVAAAARSIRRLWDAVLVVEQDQPDEYGANHEGKQAREPALQRELQLVNLRHALHRCEVDVGPAAEGEKEAHDAVVNVGGVDDDRAEDHAQACHKVQDERLYGRHPDRGSGEDGVVGELLRHLVQDGAQRHAPSETAAAALECRADKDPVAEVVQEVADGHCADHAGPGGSACHGLLRIRAVLNARLRDLRLSLAQHGRNHRHGHTLEDGRQQEAREHHRPPTPKHINLLRPAHCDEVRGFEEQKEKRAREEGACSESGQDALDEVGVGPSKRRDARHSQDYSDQRDQVD
mmetsp:Transcript_52787/g.147029  ORF Transcript_52787/g.147029 Transcript_52787/m.147029 type:complete len:395 (-) Transcript_52787:654-1838(-)